MSTTPCEGAGDSMSATDKCWCERGLVEAVMTPPEGGDRVYPVCSIHGADYVWRPCKLAGPELASFDKKYVRACRAGGKPGGFWKFEAIPEVCTACPVPAALEAVKAHCVAHGCIPSRLSEVYCDGCALWPALRALGEEPKP